MMPKKIEISHRTIIFTVLFLLSLWFLFKIKQIIFLVYVSYILMVALNPLVRKLERLRIPRAGAILVCYFLFLGILSLTIGSFLPVLVEQTKRLIEYALPLINNVDYQINQNAITNQLGSLPERSLRLVAGVFSNFVSLFVLLVVTFYLLMERKNLTRYLLILFGEAGQKRAAAIVNKIEHQLGSWVRGQVILCTIVGLMTYVGLWFLGMQFALPLAILAGVLEVVPNIGPFLAAVPAVLLGLTISPLGAVAVAALYFLIQQLENYLIVPTIMRRAVRLSPLMVILALMIGFKMGGILGTLLAVPTVLILRVFVLEFGASKSFQKV